MLAVGVCHVGGERAGGSDEWVGVEKRVMDKDQVVVADDEY